MNELYVNETVNEFYERVTVSHPADLWKDYNGMDDVDWRVRLNQFLLNKWSYTLLNTGMILQMTPTGTDRIIHSNQFKIDTYE